MTTRRYILIGIPIACILSIIVSIVISKPKGELKSAKRNTPSARQLQNVSGNSKDTVTQTVQGLTMPSYDEQGKEVIIMRGENTILLNDNVYKIISPEIEVTDSANTGDGTQSVFITSENGEMNKTSEEGYLSDNVVIHFDPDTRLNTDSLRYLPEKSLFVRTNPLPFMGKAQKLLDKVAK